LYDNAFPNPCLRDILYIRIAAKTRIPAQLQPSTPFLPSPPVNHRGVAEVVMLELTPIVLVAVGVGVVAAGDVAIAFTNISIQASKYHRSSTCWLVTASNCQDIGQYCPLLNQLL
jgi:hypothetical protein